MARRDDATLRLPSEAIDIGGVLARRAEEFLRDNPGQEIALRRLLTLRLVAVPPFGEPVRRETRRAECTEEEWALAARLADHPWRLVVTSESEADGEIIAEVAHEALLRAWPRLGNWLREERDFLEIKGELEQDERRWRTSKKAITPSWQAMISTVPRCGCVSVQLIFRQTFEGSSRPAENSVSFADSRRKQMNGFDLVV
jgi:hypothetical protein